MPESGRCLSVPRQTLKQGSRVRLEVGTGTIRPMPREPEVITFVRRAHYLRFEMRFKREAASSTVIVSPSETPTTHPSTIQEAARAGRQWKAGEEHG